jgi:hypothetical protein
MSISSSQSARGAPSTDGQRGIARLLLLAVAWLLLTLSPVAFGYGTDSVTSAAQQASIEQHRIDYLIASVAALKNASFIRNGKAYDAARAASHLRLKRRFAGSKVKTAEDFIRYCATASSMSGIRYTIRFADGHSMDSASFFQQKLALYRPEKTQGSSP